MTDEIFKQVKHLWLERKQLVFAPQFAPTRVEGVTFEMKYQVCRSAVSGQIKTPKRNQYYLKDIPAPSAKIASSTSSGILRIGDEVRGVSASLSVGEIRVPL
jgi:hypothetical protein